MNGRRVTALLLTAFLVAEALFRLQGGTVLPAVAPTAWQKVAQGAYRVLPGNYLVPQGAGSVLLRTASGASPAKRAWSAEFGGIEVALYGKSLAVAATPGGLSALQPYGGGYLMQDAHQYLWVVTRGSAHLLMGGGSGQGSRSALLESLSALKASGQLPKGWQLVWAADPLAVGSSVWFLTNRTLAPGAQGLQVWSLGAQGAAPLDTVSSLGITNLVANTVQGVLAEDSQGDLLVIDPVTYAVRQRLAGADALAVGPGGATLALQAASGKAPTLLLLRGATTSRLGLPSGARALGPAAFSADGKSLAMLVERAGKTFVYVARIQGLGALQPGDLLPPPDGAKIETWATPSLAAGRVYVVVQSGSSTQTWERSVGDGQTALGGGPG